MSDAGLTLSPWARRLATAWLASCALAWITIAGPSTAFAAANDVVLSNETTTTVWATADETVPIRALPSDNSARVARLRLQTPDGWLQSYLVLRQRQTRSGPWIQLRIPMLPNGKTGWVPRTALGYFEHVHTQLVINRAAELLTFKRNGHVLLRTAIGVGKRATPTPAGHFWITEGFRSEDPAYGPYAFATSAYSNLTDWPGGGVVGIHGTNQPWLVPGRPSHGCIRLHNRDIMRLAALIPIGTPVLIV
jgi:L,D-transpeptidase catalytic domain